MTIPRQIGGGGPWEVGGEARSGPEVGAVDGESLLPGNHPRLLSGCREFWSPMRDRVTPGQDRAQERARRVGAGVLVHGDLGSVECSI